jgi:competence protein ComEA
MSYLLGSLTTLLIVGGGQFLLRRPDPPPIVLHPPPTAAPTATPGPTETPLPAPTSASITVYVSGAVQQPGLYQLPGEARVGDALVAAGGMTADANAALVNQAEKLLDGAQVHVPNNSAEAQASMMQTESKVAAPAALNSTVTDTSSGRINVNTASLEELDSLPGIGPSKAQAIIDNRPYANLSDLERVPGIGPSTLAELRDLVTVQ